MKNWIRNSLLFIGVLCVLCLAIWGPERVAEYRDKGMLEQIREEAVQDLGEGYRYSLNSNERLYILSMCLKNQKQPETEQYAQNRLGTDNVSYEELRGSYAFVLNRQGPNEKEIKATEIIALCNDELEELKKLHIIPTEIKEITEEAYTTELYSAIDVLDPRNNLSVWKVSISTSHENADKSNRLLDAYVDAETGKIYEFYVRCERDWEELEAENIIKNWCIYLELEGLKKGDSDNPLLETTPNFLKYELPGMDRERTTVTIGFYEGIRELFLKISE